MNNKDSDKYKKYTVYEHFNPNLLFPGLNPNIRLPFFLPGINQNIPLPFPLPGINQNIPQIQPPQKPQQPQQPQQPQSPQQINSKPLVLENQSRELDTSGLGEKQDIGTLLNPTNFFKLQNLQKFANDIFTKSVDQLLDSIELPKINISKPINDLITQIVNTEVNNMSIKKLTIRILKDIEKTLNKLLFTELRNKLIFIADDINETLKSLQEPIFNINKDIKIINDLVISVLKDYDIVALIYLFFLPYVYNAITVFVENVPFLKNRNIKIETVINIMKITGIILMLACIYLFLNFIF